MKLQTKISLAILPMMAVVIFTFGAWSVMTSSRGIHDALYQVVLTELQDYVEHSVADYHQTLVKHDIAGVRSFVDSYKKMAFSDADKLYYHETGHMMIFNAEGKQLYCSTKHGDDIASNWKPVIDTIRSSPEPYVRGHVGMDSISEIYLGHYFAPWEWTIIYAISDDELMAPARQIKKATVITAIFCTFIGFILIFIVQKYFIIRPVTTLMQATGSVAALKQVEQIEVTTRDELGTLARSMESMAHAIQAHRKEKEKWQEHLELQIEERTAELQDSNLSLTREVELRTKINAKLSENERFLSVVLDSIQDGISVLDTQLNIVRVNQAMNKLYPDKTPLEGKKCYEAFHDRTEHCDMCPGLTSLQTGNMEKEEISFVNSGRECGLLEVFAFPMQDDSGKATGVVEYVRDITEQKRMESALIESEEKFRRIFETMQDGYLLTNLDGDILLANPSAVERLGYPSVDELMTKNVMKDIYINQDERENLINQMKEKGRVEAFSLTLKRQDSTPFYADCNIQLVKDSTGKTYAMEGVFRDVTERVLARRELELSEERFRAIFESTRDCILVWDRQYDYLYANQAAIDHVGTTRDNVIGKNIRDGLGHIPDFMHLWMERIDRVFDNGQSIRVEDAAPVGDQLVYSESILSPIKDSDGRIFAVGVVYRDVTGHKKMLQEISEAHELNERITSSPSLGIAVYEESGQCVFANEALATLIGASRGDCLKQNFKTLDSWKQSGLSDMALSVLEDGVERDKQLHVVSSFGKEIWLNCKLTRFYKNLYPHLLLFVEDISEKIAMMAQLEKRNHELEQSNKELDDFAYIASHDLKEPLRGIANYSGFLMEDYGDVLDDEGKSKLETLVRLCKREENLIESLLSYSRVGRTELAIKPVNLNITVQDTIDRILPTISENGINIEIRDTLPTLPCDNARIGEVFYNLVTNSIKYNDNASKKVEIGVVSGEDVKYGSPLNQETYGRYRHVFFVRDNGIGIREKHTGKIFGIFKRLHGREKYGGGAGAGLTIVDKIIKRHGGSIWVESEVGKGSIFYFTLEGENT